MRERPLMSDSRRESAMSTLTLALCAALLLAAAPVGATGAANPAPHPARTKAARARTDAGSAPASARAGAMPRTLADVHIEGEIPVPQVLFITARDQRRFMDFQHHRYLKTSLQLGGETPFPAWVAVMPNHSIDSRKENSR